MALTRTSAAADITANQIKGLSITSTSSGFPAVGALGLRQLMQIDAEYMIIDQVVASGIVDVIQRGYNGTAAVAHDILAPVTTSSNNQDFMADAMGAVDRRPPYVDDQITIGENATTIACPVRNTTYVITKATALSTTTLAAPPADADGLRVTVTSATAAAHVLTATMEDGTTGGSTTATFTAFKGASMILEACNSIWNVIAVQNVTIT